MWDHQHNIADITQDDINTCIEWIQVESPNYFIIVSLEEDNVRQDLKYDGETNFDL